MVIVIVLIVVFILTFLLVVADSYFESKKFGKRYKPYHKQLAISRLKWFLIVIVITICVIIIYPEDNEDEGAKAILSMILFYGVLIYYLKVNENLFPPRLMMKVHKALNDIGNDLLKKRTEIVNGSNWLPVHFETEWDFTHYCIDREIEEKREEITQLSKDGVPVREIALRLIKKLAKSRFTDEEKLSVKEAHYKYFYNFADEEVKMYYK